MFANPNAVLASLPLALLLPWPAAGQILTDATATRFPTPAPTEYTNHMSAGDLDGDGDLDLVFANGGNFSSAGTPQVQRVYINNGSGTFTDESAARLGFSGLCRGVAMGDIDGDGDLDLAFAQDFVRRPALFRNNGAGVFTDVTAARLPNQNLSSSRGQFADIDNDGDLDLYFVNGNASRFGCGQFKVYVNDGLGFYADETAARHPTENVCEPMDVAIGDVDGDFDLDLRSAGRGSSTSRLYRNNGAGVFTTVAGMPADSTAYSYDFGDVDGDGDLDLLGANAAPASAESLQRNDGNAAFTDISGNLTPANPGDDDNDSKFFDYDNDGDLDLILAQIGGPEKVYQNDGAGVFTETAGIIQQISDSTLEVLVADLSGDGRLDVVTGQGESGSFVNRIYISTGAVDTRPPRVIATEELADTVSTAGPYVVRAEILDDVSSDRNFFAEEIRLTYTVNGGASQTVPMRHSGGQVYRGAIPGQAGGTVEYTVSARDFAGNTGSGQAHSFEVGADVIFADGFESGDLSAW